MAEQHTILGGKVHVYKCPNSGCWQCSSYFAGKTARTRTKEESLSRVEEIAEDWYPCLRGNLRDGEITTEKPSVRPPSNSPGIRHHDQGERWATSEASTADRPSIWCRFRTAWPIGSHFGEGSGIPDFTGMKRPSSSTASRPAPSTMHQQIVTLRQH
jgi:hypothetical protein